jgi:ABC-type uncharacterized transport system fused permease/ATPase subunit
LNSKFLLDVLHALVHFQGFRNRLASFWTDIVKTKTAKYQEAVQKSKLESDPRGIRFRNVGIFEFLNSGFLLDVRHGLVHFQGFRNRLAPFWPEHVFP